MYYCKKTKQVEKDNKSLRKRDVAKIIKQEDRTRQCQRRKNIQKKCVSNQGKKNNNVQENINFTHNEETHVKNVKNYDKRQVLKIVKEKKRIKEQPRRNCNTLQINTNVKSRKLQKKLHVSRIWPKQNLANTLNKKLCYVQSANKI